MKESNLVIDDDHISSSRTDIRIDNGFSFGSTTRLSAGIISVFGILALLTGGAGYILGPVVILASLFALTSKYGMEISLSNNYIREYSSAFGIKTGKWVSTIGLPDIAVMRIGKKKGFANYLTGSVALEIDATASEVYLLSANHRKRVLVKTCGSGKEAFDLAKDLAQKMNKNLVEFNPAISEKSKARR